MPYQNYTIYVYGAGTISMVLVTGYAIKGELYLIQANLDNSGSSLRKPASKGLADLSDIHWVLKNSRFQGDQRCSWICEKSIPLTGRLLMQPSNRLVQYCGETHSKVWSQFTHLILTPHILGCLFKQSNNGQLSRQANSTGTCQPYLYHQNKLLSLLVF